MNDKEMKVKFRQAIKILKQSGPTSHWGYAFIKRWLIISDEERDLIRACRKNVKGQSPTTRKALKRKRLSILAKDFRWFEAMNDKEIGL